MNRVTLTIHIDTPNSAQVTPDVTYSQVPTTHQAPAAGGGTTAAGAWVCPEHGSRKIVPAGVSKRTGNKYGSFVACAERGCDQKPPPGPGPGDIVASDVSQFDDLPF